MDEEGSELLAEAMLRAPRWFTCRIGFVEVVRAVEMAGGVTAARRAREEWTSLGIVDVDQRLVEEAAKLTLAHGLRSLDGLHLAAALVLPRADVVLATWDKRLHAAALAVGLKPLPEVLD